jgi:hypothetical protein
MTKQPVTRTTPDIRETPLPTLLGFVALLPVASQQDVRPCAAPFALQERRVRHFSWVIARPLRADQRFTACAAKAHRHLKQYGWKCAVRVRLSCVARAISDGTPGRYSFKMIFWFLTILHWID